MAAQDHVSRARGRLMVLFGPGAGRTVDFDDEISIGRSSKATLRFPDGDVSRYHARICRDGDGEFEIADLGSANGTLVNGEVVEKARLEYGDRIQVGLRVTLVFSHADEREETLLHGQRLESLGLLASTAAHDLNGFLTAILCAIDFVSRRGKELDEDSAESLREARTAARDAAALSRQILGLARRTQIKHQPLDLAPLLREILALVGRTCGTRIQFEVAIEPDLIVVGDRTQLLQILLNLLLNARDAMPGGGILTICASLASVGEARAAQNATLFPGEYLQLTIADTGCGKAPEALERAFEPFFTTKKGGTGLGLATVRSIVRGHGGHIDVESRVDVGTEFRIYLPAAAESVGRIDPHAATETIAGCDRRTILIADAEPLTRNATRRLLDLFGFAVHGAANLEELLELLGRHPAALVLVDLPEVESILTLLREIDEQVVVVRILGEQAEADDASPGLTLSRPFGLDALAAVLTQALG